MLSPSRYRFSIPDFGDAPRLLFPLSTHSRYKRMSNIDDILSVPEEPPVGRTSEAKAALESTQFYEVDIQATPALSWVPFFLRLQTLLAFAAVYALIALALIILYIWSSRHQGLGSSKESYHYFWTYGPTAVFMVLIGLWTQVEYNSKLVAPWRAMSKGPKAVDRGLLLDYVSESRFYTPYTSLKNRDFTVFLPVLGSLFLQLIIIFSTGLFDLEERAVTYQNSPLLTTSKFIDAPHNGTVDSRAFSNAWAFQMYGLGTPEGTTKEFAYQSIKAVNSRPNSTVTATVDALWADVDCELANSTWRLESHGLNPSGKWTAYMNASKDNCHCGFYDFTSPELLTSYYTHINVIHCTDSSGKMTPEQKWVIFAGHTSRDDYNYGPDSLGYNSTISMKPNSSTRSTCLFCTPKVGIRKAVVTTTDSKTTAIMQPGDSIPAKNVSAFGLVNATLASMSSADAFLTGPVLVSGSGDTRTATNGVFANKWFQLMNATMPPQTLEGLLDAEFLQKSATKVYQAITAQLAEQYLFEHTESPISGSIIDHQERIVVRPLSFGVLVGLLAVLVIICIILCCFQPYGVLPKDPSSLFSLATILARSSDVTRRVQHTSLSAKETQEQLSLGGTYQTKVAFDYGVSKFCISNPEGGAANDIFQRSNERTYLRKIKWWKPLATSSLWRFLVFFLPLATIAALEVLLQRSNRYNGVQEAPSNQYTHYLWVYIPAIFVLCIKALFEGLQFITKVFQPYTLMRSKPIPARKCESQVGRTTIMTIWYSVREKQYGILAASIAILLGAILPISVSGLFTGQQVNQMLPTLIRQMDQFNASMGFYNTSAYDPFPIPSLLIYNNLSYPKGTYEQYAFANLELHMSRDVANSPNNFNDTSLNALVPAVRGVPNCTAIPASAIRHKVTYETGSTNHYRLAINSSSTEGCYGSQVTYLLNATSDFYFGSWTSGIMVQNISGYPLGEAVPYNAMQEDDSRYHGMRKVPPQCPLTILAFGKGHVLGKPGENASYAVDDVTVLHCWPYTEQTLLNTTFTLPDLNVDTRTPPRPISNSTFFSEAEIISGSAAGMAPRPLNKYLASITGDYNPSTIMSSTPNNVFDLFMQAVIWGNNGVPAKELIGSGSGTQKLLKRTEEVYGIMMAQLFNSKARMIRSNGEAVSTYTGLKLSSHVRLFQSEISTRILQGVLAAMILCAVATIFLIQTSRILPQNPCSIGATASLLAGSSLLSSRVIPPGSEFLSDEQLYKKGVLEGHLLSLGWWGSGEERRFGIDIGRGDREK